jgi:hypothetical protein
MGIAVLAFLLVLSAVFAIRAAAGRLVCPFCDGPIRRVFEKTECQACGRSFFLWQARRRGRGLDRSPRRE